MIIRRLKGWLKSLVPAPLKQQLKRRLRRQRLKDIRDAEVPVTAAEFAEALSVIGVAEGQVLFVHSGADWLRSVEGGPMNVLKMLRAAVGEKGTLAMPSFPFDSLASDYLASASFDIRRSPSKMGLLTEIFRRLPDVTRSLHPTHPVCAQGPLAEYLTEGHHLDERPFGPSSPFGRIEENNGKILMIGVDSAFLTHVHVAEDLMGEAFPVPVYLEEAVEATVLDELGNEKTLTTRVHDPAVSRLKAISRFEREWTQARALDTGTVGHIELRLFDAAALTASLQGLAEAEKTIYA